MRRRSDQAQNPPSPNRPSRFTFLAEDSVILAAMGTDSDIDAACRVPVPQLTPNRRSETDPQLLPIPQVCNVYVACNCPLR